MSKYDLQRITKRKIEGNKKRMKHRRRYTWKNDRANIRNRQQQKKNMSKEMKVVTYQGLCMHKWVPDAPLGEVWKHVPATKTVFKV